MNRDELARSLEKLLVGMGLLVRQVGDLKAEVASLREGKAAADGWTMRVADVARFVNKSEDWVYRNSAAGTFPGEKIGGEWRYRLSEIEAWITSQRPAERAEEPRPTSSRRRRANDDASLIPYERKKAA